jgi:DNA polymerase-4
VGKQMEKRLDAHGIRTVKDLAGAHQGELRTVWGGVGGDVMYERIRGEQQHEREVQTTPSPTRA